MSAQQLFEQAKENYDLGIMSLTEETLMELIAQYPDYAPAHHLLAQVAYHDNQGFEVTIAHYENAIKADPTNIGYKHEKACKETLSFLLNGGEKNEMLNILNPILQQNPTHAEANFLMAGVLNNDWENPADKNLLLKHYDIALAHDNTHQEWFIKRAEVHQSIDFDLGFPRPTTQHLQNALADYTSAIDINPMNDWASGAYHQKAGILVQLERFEDAIAELELLRIFPGDNARYMDTAITLMAEIRIQSMHDYQGALQNYNELVEYVESVEDEFVVTPLTKSTAYHGRGKLKIEHLNQKTEGVADLKKAMEYSPDDEFFKEEYNENK